MNAARSPRLSAWIAGFLLALIVSWRATSPPRATAGGPAELVVKNARIWTADPGRPWAETLAVREGRFTFVGAAAEEEGITGPKTRVVDAGGRLILPGFNDSHVHLVSGALSLELVDLIEDQTVGAVQARIKAFAAAHPEAPWVRGRGWLYGSFPSGLPTKEQLDAAVPDRPAYMECYDGHSGWANSKALALAGITKDTKDPKDGVIVRDPGTGEPTGALKERATDLVASKIPEPDAEGRYALFLRALRRLNAQGITSVQDAGTLGSSPTDPELTKADLFGRALREGQLTVRIAAAVGMQEGQHEAAIAEARRLKSLHDDAYVRFGRVKGYVDGVIEAHTAALLEPYSDDASFGLGLPNWSPEGLAQAVATADRAGLQVYLHAIGDRGVRMALDAHEAAARANGQRDRRGRIEHIETIHPAEYPRFGALGVIASMQPLHANPDQNSELVWRKNAGAERSSRGFSWGNLERAGARIVFGSDWPVVTSDVFRGLYCAVTRRTREGTPPGGWLPEQAVKLESALRHYTIDGAYASFEEDDKGSISLGKRADFVVLSEDLFRAAPEGILKTKVLLTAMDGRVVHRDAPF
jgi:predicted amidohydrolase YtcJ